MSGLRVNVDRREAPVAVPEQGGGNGTGPQTKVSACLDNMVRLGGTDERIPAQPPGPERLVAQILRRGFDDIRSVRCSRRSLSSSSSFIQARTCAIFAPVAAAKPAELVSVQRAQVVGEISGLAATDQPID